MGDSAKPIVVINQRHLPIYLGESEIQVGTGEGKIIAAAKCPTVRFKIITVKHDLRDGIHH